VQKGLVDPSPGIRLSGLTFQRNIDFQKPRLFLRLTKPQNHLLHDPKIKRRQPDMGVYFNTGILAAAFSLTGFDTSCNWRRRANLTEGNFAGGKKSVGNVLMSLEIVI